MHAGIDALWSVIGRAVLAVGATAGLAALLFVIAVFLIASAVTGMWHHRPTPDRTDYEEAA